MNKSDMTKLQNKINELACKYSDYVINIRRDIHKHPETAWMEARTSAIIARELKKIGYTSIFTGKDVCDDQSRYAVPDINDIKAHYEFIKNNEPDLLLIKDTSEGFTGVIAELKCGDGPVTALRFDIDALPITESSENDHFPTANGFNSVYSGYMHACGHDCHAAIGLGTAAVLFELRNELKGTYRIIFQPSEEGARGAGSIAKHGYLDDVSTVLGMHVCENGYQDAQIIIESGKTLATSKLNVDFTGKEAHAAAAPQVGHNALLAACTAVQNLYAISRHSESDTRINVGILNAGKGRNIICPDAHLEMEVRGYTTVGNEYMYDRAITILESAAAMHDCSCSIMIMGRASSVLNDPSLALNVVDICAKSGINCAYLPDRDWSASEDYSVMAEYVQSRGGRSCYLKLITGGNKPLHDCCFDVDEHSLSVGVAALVSVAVNF